MKKAIVLGGTHDHIGLIDILRQKGYHIWLIDYLENPPAKKTAHEHIRESVLDLQKVVEIAKELKPDLVIASCIDQALLTMAYVCEELALPCHISYKTALELTNKAYMKQKFFENDIPTSQHILLDEISVDVPDELEFPMVVKPVDSNSSKGIVKVFKSSELKDAMKYAFTYSRSHRIVVEEYKEGEEFSIDVVIEDFEPHIMLVSKNRKMQQNEKNFTIVQSYYSATNDSFLLDSIYSIAKRIAVSYNIRYGPLLIQLIYDGRNISVVEFSSRIGGGSKHHLIRKITGFDVLKYFVNLLSNEHTEIKIAGNYNFACVDYIYAHDGIIREFVDFDKLQSEGIIEQHFHYKTIGMAVTNHIASSDRPAGYLIVDNQHERLYEKSKIADQRIKILDETGRDIVMHGIHEHKG